ncbi:MAG: PEGA domain-containing protein [Deltaproteobacteria bacterium]|nr:PEGA domain-containing protein [Deltaproteobacteria bacterium]
MEAFGPYDLIEKIATGGMAEIFLARKAGVEGFEKLLVLKRILPHLAESQEFVEMFLHEARVAVRLNHPNVVQIFDLGKEAGAYFIAMEYIHGEDVRRVWRQSEAQQKLIPVPLVCRIVMDAAAGLDYAHKKTDAAGAPLHIVHRDVSPQNILVSFQGAVKVVDFGIAKAADQASQTRAGVLKGKYSYMSPEQAAGAEIDQRTDQFALGVVLWELLAARRLFKRGSDMQTLAAVTECKVPAPNEVDSRVPAELGAIVLKATAKEPQQRFGDLHELQMALEEWLLATRQASSPSHLAAYMAELYAERLSRERAEGMPVFGEAAEPSGSADNRRRSSSRNERRRGGPPSAASKPGAPASETRAGRVSSRSGSLAVRKVGLEPAAQPSREGRGGRTPIESAITGSSVSRLVRRLSGRKKAAFGMAAMTALLGAAAVFLYQTQVLSTTSRPFGQEHPQPVEPRPDEPLVQVPLGALSISSVPPGAGIFLDAKPLGEQTPTTVEGVALGEHRIRLDLKGYRQAIKAVRVERDGETVGVELELIKDEAPALALLTVESNPAGAEVMVDGRTVGRSPLTVELPAKGTAEVEVVRDGYLSKKQTVTLGDGPQKVGFELERKPGPSPIGPQFGTLIVTSDPLSSVWEGSKELGPTPLRSRIATGRHQLVLVNRQEGLEYAFSVVVRSEETVTRTYRFDRGEVQVVVKPVTQDATIYLRNRKLGSNPLPKFSLLEGEYQLTVVNEEIKKTKRVPVIVKKGTVTKVVVNLAED